MEAFALTGPVLRSKEKMLRTSATLPVRIWLACKAVADEAEDFTRDEVIADFLDWALREYRKQHPARGRKPDSTDSRG